MRNVQIRWMVQRDMKSVMAIEIASFEFCWTEEEFRYHLRNRQVIGMVAEKDARVVGYMLYDLRKTNLHVLTFAVAPSERRKGIGSEMVTKLKAKLSQQRRIEIVLEVRESNLAAQCFFRSQGLTATDVLHGHYEDTDEDAYEMRWVLAQSCEAVPV